MAKYLLKKIDEVRENLLGAKIIDIEEKGRVIYVEDEEGRSYSIDFTGKDGAVVSANNTDSEELKELRAKFNALLTKLDFEEEDLFEFIEF